MSKVTVEFCQGYECKIPRDGATSADKVLPYMSIVYPNNGSYHVGLEDNELQYVSGACYITPPGVRHTIVHHLPSDGTPMRPQYVFLKIWYGGLVDLTAHIKTPFILSCEMSAPLIASIRESIEMEDQAFVRIAMASRIMQYLLKIGTLPPFFEYGAITPALELMERGENARFSLGNLASSCNLSIAAFSAIFKQKTGMSPMSYWRNKRLMKAASLLICSESTLAQIAGETGFFDEFHLSREFKKHYGTSPRSYRNESRQI